MKKIIILTAIIFSLHLQAKWQKNLRPKHSIEKTEELLQSKPEIPIAPPINEVSANANALIEKNEPIHKRKIKINNTVTDAQTTYTKHWSGNHTPFWKLLINGKELPSNQKTEIELEQNDIEMEFAFEFRVLGKTHRTGSACARFAIPPDTDSVDVSFSWDNQERLGLSNTIPESSKTQPRLLSFFEKR